MYVITKQQRFGRGFTIVELLIVIVVIAILAAITIVSYNGIQRRASNTAIIAAARDISKLIDMYKVDRGTYPLTVDYACVTTGVVCNDSDTGGAVRAQSTVFNTNIATVGAPPKSVPVSGSVGNGVIYNYHPNRQFNGVSRPAILMYFLNGEHQDCGLPNIMNNWGTTAPAYAVTSTTGYSGSGSASGKTVCYLSLN